MMLRRPLLFMACAGALLGLLGSGSLCFAQADASNKSPENLLSAASVVYFRSDGSIGHEEAFAETAAYQALHDSGLMEIFDEALNSLSENDKTQGMAGIIRHLQEYGLSASIALNAPKDKPVEAWGTVVVQYAAEGVELLADVLEESSQGQIDVKQSRIKGRMVKYIDLKNPLIELGFWEEGPNLVLAVGMNAISNAIAVADGKQPDITQHPLWEQYSTFDDDYEVTQLSWFDAKSLREKLGNNPIPGLKQEDGQPVTVNQILEVLGIQSLNHISTVAGYRGESLWSEVRIDAPGERTGLMSLLDQEAFTLEDLPAMPLQHAGITAFSFNANQAYETGLKILRDLIELGPNKTANDDLDRELENVRRKLGFAPEELLAALGSIHCLYTDTAQGPFGLGVAGLVEVADQEKLADCFRKVFKLIQGEVRRENGLMVVHESEDAEGRIQFRLDFPQAPIFTPTFSVGEDWLIVGLVPQAVQAQLLRMDGTLFSWSIQDDLEDALGEMPKEMTSVAVIDPAGSYRAILGLAPTILRFVEVAVQKSGAVPPNWQLPIDVNAIPPAELVVQPLFLNITMGAVDDSGWRVTSRMSLPGTPFMGGSGPEVGVATSAVLVALLLPAVQQAREAARRTQSRNNLKHIGLAMHNYHDTFGYFPQGTVPNDALEPDQRLSWLVSLLPFLDHARLYNEIDLKSGWKADDNKENLETELPGFQNPSQKAKLDSAYAPTHYIGIGGVGKDGPTLPVTSNRAGMFGYNRVTKLRDVKDGSSNTVMVSDASQIAPWGEGGPATIRALTEKPYINGPDGIGSPHTGGANMLLGDGAVRFVSENVDAKVLEALSTINGGEVVDDF